MDISSCDTRQPSYAGEVQYWQGYWLQFDTVGDMQIEIFHASDNRVYGYGCDAIGLFTWKGSFEGRQVLLTKKYLSQHGLQYRGYRTVQNTMEGEWIIGPHSGGNFYFERSHEVEKSPPVTAYLQEWKGHRVFEQNSGETIADLVFTSEGKVYGGGTDDLGSFTFLGNYHRKGETTIVGMLKQYDEGGAVNYEGLICRKGASMVMEGMWTDEHGQHCSFSLTTWNTVPDAEE